MAGVQTMGAYNKSRGIISNIASRRKVKLPRVS